MPLCLTAASPYAREVTSQVTTIRSLSDTSDKLNQLNSQLRTSDDLLKRSLAVLPDVLSTLDPTAFTLGWLFILCVSFLPLAPPSCVSPLDTSTPSRGGLSARAGGGGSAETRWARRRPTQPSATRRSSISPRYSSTAARRSSCVSTPTNVRRPLTLSSHPPPYPPPACPHAELMRGTVRMYSPQSRASHGG